MTELEMIQRAKIYMEKLAMGINPLDDRPVPEEDLINNVHISRCFTFTAQMLGRMMETQKKPSKKRPPLSLDFDKRNEFEFSDEPIPVSEISKRLNNLITDERMLRLNYSDITAWLLEIDLLYSKSAPDGKYARYPTPQGKNMGITTETRSGTYGTYDVVLYDRKAQQFILDNLDAVINIRNMRAEKRGTPWSASEDALLKSMHESGYPLIDMSALLRRSSPSIRKHAEALGISIAMPNDEQDEE